MDDHDRLSQMSRQPVAELRFTPDAQTTERYAAASGDHNPIHTDPEAARAAGLPGTILHGLYTMAQLARCATLAAAKSGQPAALTKLSLEFRGMAVPMSELVLAAEITEQSPRRIVLELSARQDGKRLIRRAHAELETTPPLSRQR